MSLDIRDYVIEAHKNAERQEFVKTMMSGDAILNDLLILTTTICCCY